MKFATIGSGWIVKDFLQATKTFKELEYSICYSRKEQTAIDFLNESGSKAKIVTSLNEINDVDFVYIASPNGLHYEQTKFILEKGISVLLEKPATFTKSEILELKQIANDKKIFLMEGIKNIHCKEYIQLEEILQNLNVNSAIFNQNSYSSRMADVKKGIFNSVFDEKLGKGCVYDVLVYPVELGVSLFGNVKQIESISSKVANRVSIQDHVILQHESGVLTTIVASKNNFQTINSQIFAGEFSIEIVEPGSLLEVKLFDHQTKTLVKSFKKEVDGSFLVGEIADFLSIIKNNDFDTMNKLLEITIETIRILEQVACK